MTISEVKCSRVGRAPSDQHRDSQAEGLGFSPFQEDSALRPSAAGLLMMLGSHCFAFLAVRYGLRLLITALGCFKA